MLGHLERLDSLEVKDSKDSEMKFKTIIYENSKNIFQVIPLFLWITLEPALAPYFVGPILGRVKSQIHIGWTPNCPN